MVRFCEGRNNMIDRTTKALLIAIAVGLWVNVASSWLQPVPVRAEAAAVQGDSDFYASLIYSELGSIQDNLSNISLGVCLNSKIC